MKILCPKCKTVITKEVNQMIASRAGRSKSEEKSNASRINGLKGGRTKKIIKQVQS